MPRSRRRPDPAYFCCFCGADFDHALELSLHHSNTLSPLTGCEERRQWRAVVKEAALDAVREVFSEMRGQSRPAPVDPNETVYMAAAARMASYAGPGKWTAESIRKYSDHYWAARKAARIRCHPDRPETGSHETFLEFQKADKVLEGLHGRE